MSVRLFGGGGGRGGSKGCGGEREEGDAVWGDTGSVCERDGSFTTGSGRSEFREGVWAVWAWGCWGGAGGSAAGRRGVALLLLRRCWGALGAAAGRRSVLFVRGVRGARFRARRCQSLVLRGERGEEAKVGRNGGMRRPGQLVGSWRGGGEAGSLLCVLGSDTFLTATISVSSCAGRARKVGRRTFGGAHPRANARAGGGRGRRAKMWRRGRVGRGGEGGERDAVVHKPWRVASEMTNIPRESNRHKTTHTGRSPATRTRRLLLVGVGPFVQRMVNVVRVLLEQYARISLPPTVWHIIGV